MTPRRIFTAEEDALIRRAHAGELHMRELRTRLRTDLLRVYRRMAELGLPYRKPDRRTRPTIKRDYLQLRRT
jgi:hypothetical protein